MEQWKGTGRGRGRGRGSETDKQQGRPERSGPLSSGCVGVGFQWSEPFGSVLSWRCGGVPAGLDCSHHPPTVAFACPLPPPRPSHTQTHAAESSSHGRLQPQPAMPTGAAQQHQQLLPHPYSVVPPCSSADMDDLSVSDSDVDGASDVDGFGVGGGGLLSDGPGGRVSVSVSSVFSARRLLTFWQLALLLAAAFIAGAAIAGGAVYAWKEKYEGSTGVANGRGAIRQGAMQMAAGAVTDNDNDAGPATTRHDQHEHATSNHTGDAHAPAPAPASSSTGGAADAAGAGVVSLGGVEQYLGDGYRAAFYHGPQHLVRYPGTIPYLSEHAPFCHYERPGDAPAPTAGSLLACIHGARASYQTNPLQSSQLPCNRRRKVYDTFRYNDEDELLETRLEENFAVVDYFVVVESPMAFTGIRKEMAFAAAVAAGKYAKWMAKIIHVTCDLSHIVTPDDNEKNHFRGWAREFATTDCVLFGLGQAGPDDIVLYGDTDEIPRPDLLSALQMCSVEMGALTETPAHPQALRLSGPRFVGNWEVAALSWLSCSVDRQHHHRAPVAGPPRWRLVPRPRPAARHGGHRGRTLALFLVLLRRHAEAAQQAGHVERTGRIRFDPQQVGRPELEELAGGLRRQRRGAQVHALDQSRPAAQVRAGPPGAVPRQGVRVRCSVSSGDDTHAHTRTHGRTGAGTRGRGGGGEERRLGWEQSANRPPSVRHTPHHKQLRFAN